jgi:valyl-tRNA synthetase
VSWFSPPLISNPKSLGRRINIGVERVKEYSQFCDKIFQATTYALLNLGPDFTPELMPTVGGLVIIILTTC